MTVTPTLAGQLGFDVERGALVAGVVVASPANAAGLRGGRTAGGALTGDGDVIVRVGAREIDSSEDLRNAISDLRRGDRVEIEVVREGDRRTLRVQLSASG